MRVLFRPYILIILLGLCVYAFSLPNAMFWDDVNFILLNDYIKDFSHWPQWFSQNIVAGSNHLSNYWRPLLLAVFSVEWHWWKDWVVGWHAINMFIHIGAALGVYALMLRLVERNAVALLCALVFLLHPVQTEAVVYVNSLGDSLSALFVVLSLIFYIDGRRKKIFIKTLSAFVFIVLGLMFKETAFVAPFLIVAVEVLFIQQDQRLIQRLRKAIPIISVGLGLAAIYLALRATVLNFDNTFNLYAQPNIYTDFVYIRVFTFFKTLVIYSGILVYPVGLHVERTVSMAQSFCDPFVLAGAALVLASMATALMFWRKRPLVTFGIIWFYVCLAPTCNILIPINAMLYEHWLYMPIVGLALVLLELFWPKQHAQAALKIITIIFAVYAVLSIVRIADWRTEEGFYKKTLQYSPNNMRILNNLGVLAYNRQDMNAAIGYFQSAIKANPQEPAAYYNLAWMQLNAGQTDAALSNFEMSHQIDATYRLVYRPLAILYAQRHDRAKLNEILPKAKQFFPNDPAIQGL